MTVPERRFPGDSMIKTRSLLSLGLSTALLLGGFVAISTPAAAFCAGLHEETDYVESCIGVSDGCIGAEWNDDCWLGIPRTVYPSN